MKNSTTKDTLVNALFVISAIFLFFLSLLISYEITIHTIPKTPNQQETIQYILTPSISIPQGYTQNEIDHLYDVKKITTKIPTAIIIITLLITISIFGIHKLKEFKCKELKSTENKFSNNKINLISLIQTISSISKLSIIFAILFITIIIINFNLTFTYFHYLLFPQGNWQFPYDSKLITTFPESFFNTITILIAIVTILLQLIAPTTNYIIKRKVK